MGYTAYNFSTILHRRFIEGHSNFLLAVFHRQKMAKFDLEDRRIILRTMPPRARQVWTELI